MTSALRSFAGLLPAAAWVAIILGASLFAHPSDVLPSGFRIWDKALHAAAFAVFGLLAAGGLDHAVRWRAPATHLALLTTLLAFGLGCLDEFIQWHRPSRTAEWGDVIADTVGGLLGAMTFLILRDLSRRLRRNPPHDSTAGTPPLR
ncbi:MAG: VanZ family protein [Deltaproteobacteria bacterium]|nr:MAG: VanZ family protein [Deltaproteobacteria bacterium]